MMRREAASSLSRAPEAEHASAPELLARLRRLAYEDPLTGLANRRALEEELERLVAEDTALALVMGDVDGLKELNDARGHDEGDAALRRVAEALGQVADGAFIARLGGDEFCLLLTGDDALRAGELAQAAVDRVAGGPSALGLSCGVALPELGLRRAGELLRAADAALYLAKRTGRGRVCVAERESERAWASAPRERRAVRGPSGFDLPTLLLEAVTLLDRSLRDCLPLERLRAVATLSAHAAGAAALAVSELSPCGTGLVSRFTLDLRSGHSAGLAGAIGDFWPLADYPVTARVLREGGFAVVRDDAGADPAERELLARWNLAGVLLVPAGKRWLVEVYAEVGPADLDLVAAAVRLLAAEAVR